MKVKTLLTSIGLGAGLMYFLDPQHGTRRRTMVIDRANQWAPTSASEKANKAQYLGEAKFMRAYAYFNLVNNWGRVPLHTSYEETTQNPFPERASVADIWAFIEQDLKDAEASLPVKYPSEWLGRATRGAAVCMR